MDKKTLLEIIDNYSKRGYLVPQRVLDMDVDQLSDLVSQFRTLQSATPPYSPKRQPGNIQRRSTSPLYNRSISSSSFPDNTSDSKYNSPPLTSGELKAAILRFKIDGKMLIPTKDKIDAMTEYELSQILSNLQSRAQYLDTHVLSPTRTGSTISHTGYDADDDNTEYSTSDAPETVCVPVHEWTNAELLKYIQQCKRLGIQVEVGYSTMKKEELIPFVQRLQAQVTRDQIEQKQKYGNVSGALSPLVTPGSPVSVTRLIKGKYKRQYDFKVKGLTDLTNVLRTFEDVIDHMSVSRQKENDPVFHVVLATNDAQLTKQTVYTYLKQSNINGGIFLDSLTE
jgi:hypothetical protein